MDEQTRHAHHTITARALNSSRCKKPSIFCGLGNFMLHGSGCCYWIALFAFRESSFVFDVLQWPNDGFEGRLREKYLEAFVDEYEEIAEDKLNILIEKIKTKFSVQY